MTEPTRFGFVAILGAPNAGKSTLVNRICGGKVSIVTPKVQTTRFPVRGIAMIGAAQIVLVDTPGIFSPKRRLEKAMVAAAWDGAGEGDAVLHVVDAAAHVAMTSGQKTGAAAYSVSDSAAISARLAKANGPKFLALNKVDGLPKPDLLPVAAQLTQDCAYDAVFMISAKTGSGVDQLKEALARAAPGGPWAFPTDQLSDMPSRLAAAEITREKLFLRVHDELPYQLTVETTSWKTLRDGAARLEQTITVARDTHRQIVIGAGGSVLKSIGEAARLEMAEVFGHPVHLFLHVSVREHWDEQRGLYQAMGLDYDADPGG